MRVRARASGMALVSTLLFTFAAPIADAHLEHGRGTSVAMDRSIAVIGVPGPSSSYNGIVHVVQRTFDAWESQTSMASPDGSGSSFGHAVAIDAATIVVGEPEDSGDAPNAGAAHVFMHDGDAWIHQATLTAPGPEENDLFGFSVAVDGDTAVVGTIRQGGWDRGGAHVFVRGDGSWTYATTLTPQADQAPQFAGYAVAVEGDTVILGAPVDDGPDEGSAFVFGRQDGIWTQRELLRASRPTANGYFGSSVALDMGRALVGSHPTGLATHRAAADLFEQGDQGWDHVARLASGLDGDAFGVAVALDGETALIGAPDDNDRALGAGAIHVFRRGDGNWDDHTKLSHPHGGWSNSSFGQAVAIDDGSAVTLSSSSVEFLEPSTLADEAPNLVDDSYTVQEDALLETFPPGVLANDSDIDGDPLTASLVSPPVHGTAVIHDDGRLEYRPDANFHGFDSMTYRACAGWGCSTASVDIRVLAANDPPVALSVQASTNEDTPVYVTLRAEDVDGDPLTYAITSHIFRGTLDGTPPTLRYTPDPDYHGTEVFSFRAYDGDLWSDDAWVTIRVHPVNDPPHAADDETATPQYRDVVIDVLANDGDPDGDPLGVVGWTSPEKGTVRLNADGTLTYSPDIGFRDSDRFSYLIADPSGVVASATVRITEIGCGEDGAQALDGTPAAGAASETIDREVEPLAGRHDPGTAETTHDANCAYVVAVEDQLDDL